MAQGVLAPSREARFQKPGKQGGTAGFSKDLSLWQCKDRSFFISFSKGGAGHGQTQTPQPFLHTMAPMATFQLTAIRPLSKKETRYIP